jgi:cyclopropane fatty-acyl-phospholipid synthase-like methyltransferase
MATEARAVTNVDFSAWMDEKRFLNEKAGWLRDKLYLEYADTINEVCEQYALRTVLEVGCGAGLIPAHLNPQLTYSAVDANLHCVREACARNPTLSISLEDIRDFSHPPVDLVCSFAVLKHFSLVEVSPIFKKMASFGRYFLSTIQFSNQDLDDGTVGYPHIWMEESALNAITLFADHEIVWTRSRWSGESHGIVGEEKYVLTRRME